MVLLCHAPLIECIFKSSKKFEIIHGVSIPQASFFIQHKWFILFYQKLIIEQAFVYLNFAKICTHNGICLGSSFSNNRLFYKNEKNKI